MTLGGRLSVTRALDALTDFQDLPIERWATSDALRRRAFRLRHNLTAYDLTAYDAAYVALAEALECPLLTRDAEIGRATGHGARIDVR
jgi:predicted nucleic acid-binding protein